MSILTTPGLLCTSDLDPAYLDELKARGYQWVAPQVQNAHVNTDRDLARIKAAGLRAAVWGVSYSLGDMERDGFNLGRQMVRLGATDVIADLEEFAKNSRADRKLLPYIDAIRSGGWTGPVHLTTLGAPDNSDVNDYAIDVGSFLETGGGVLPQAYLNEWPGYHPALCVRYWTRMGVPADRLNLMIGLYDGALGRLPGAEWVKVLREAGVTTNFSGFLAETALPAELDALDALTKAAPLPAPAPSPPPAPSTADTRAEIIGVALAWEVGQGGTKPLTRITLSKRICSGEIPDRKWRSYGEAIAAILDAQE